MQNIYLQISRFKQWNIQMQNNMDYTPL